MTDNDVNWPNAVIGLADEHSPLRLAISCMGISGLVICARVEAALTSWRPDGLDAEANAQEIIWGLGKV